MELKEKSEYNSPETGMLISDKVLSFYQFIPCHSLWKRIKNEIDPLSPSQGEWVLLALGGKMSVKCMLFAFLQKYITGKKRIPYNFANHVLLSKQRIFKDRFI